MTARIRVLPFFLAVTLAATACSDSDDDPSSAFDEACLQNAKETARSDNVDVQGDAAIIQGPGGVVVCGDGLPDEFEDFPLPEGEIVRAQVVGDVGGVTVELDGDPDQEADAYRELLEDEGYVTDAYGEVSGFADYTAIGDLTLDVGAIEEDGQAFLVVSYF